MKAPFMLRQRFDYKRKEAPAPYIGPATPHFRRSAADIAAVIEAARLERNARNKRYYKPRGQRF